MAIEAWESSEASKHVPEGSAYLVELLTTGGPDAVPIPESVFVGPRDKRRDVERVPQ